MLLLLVVVIVVVVVLLLLVLDMSKLAGFSVSREGISRLKASAAVCTLLCRPCNTSLVC